VRPDPYAWSLDPDGLLIGASLVIAYAAGYRLAPSPRWRVASFALGVALVLATHLTPIAAIANHYLLSVHLLQNVVLAEWAPALCVLGLAPELAARLGRLRLVRALTSPFVALPAWLVTYFAWHVPWLYDAALRHQQSLLHVEHGFYFTTGCMLWWAVVHDEPHRLSWGARGVYVFGAFVLVSPLGLLLALLPRAVYGFYVHAPRLWGLSATSDQQIAGVTMVVEEAVVFFAVCAVAFSRFLRQEEVAGAVTSGSR
jgi:cytochrome c oxidase assembly factor CtaG